MEIGSFDDVYDGHYGFEDCDLGERIKRSDLTLSHTDDKGMVIHLGEPYGNRVSGPVRIRNKEIYEKKWGPQKSSFP